MPRIPKIKAPTLIANANTGTPKKGIAQTERESYGKPAFTLPARLRKRGSTLKSRTGF